jgi:uncharacterized membrane protein
MPETEIPENELNSIAELSGDKQEKRDKIKEIVVSLLHQEFHEGPLPSPDTLKKYNDIIPDAADRIFKMAEKSQVHRENIDHQQMDIVKARVESEIKKINKGQDYALIIALTGITGAIICAFLNQVAIGSVLGGSTVVTLVSLFLSEKLRKRKEENNEDNDSGSLPAENEEEE